MWSEYQAKVQERIDNGEPGAEQKLASQNKAIKFLGSVNSEPSPVNKIEAKQGKGTALSPLQKGQKDILEALAERCKEMINVNAAKSEVDDEIAKLRRQLEEKEAQIIKLTNENESLKRGGGRGQGLGGRKRSPLKQSMSAGSPPRLDMPKAAGSNFSYLAPASKGSPNTSESERSPYKVKVRLSSGTKSRFRQIRAAVRTGLVTNGQKVAPTTGDATTIGPAGQAGSIPRSSL